MEIKRKIIEIDEELCDGCGKCVPDCAEGSLQIVDGKAKLVSDNLCDGLGACLGSCPTGALKIIERMAEDFDEEAVEKFLESLKNKEGKKEETMDCGCSSSLIQELKPEAESTMDCGCSSNLIQELKPAATPCQTANKPTLNVTNGSSALSHWPVQIRLVPPSAPFLQGADLLVAADCTAVSTPGFHETYLPGKVVMMGCPKFDDAESYVQKFAEIIATCNLNSITILIMEVPCCGSMIGIIKEAVQRANLAKRNTLAVEQITISTRGEIVNQITW